MKGKRNGKNSLAFGIFVLSADFSVSPLLCRVSFYLLNLTVSFVREYQQQRALHFALSLSKKRSLITVSHSFFCQVCKILLSLSALVLRCCSLCIALFGLFAHFYLRSLSLRFRRRAAMSCCCCSLTIWGALSLNCGAFVLLFSSITVSFAALRLFCCFAFCLAFASAAALAWPCCCCCCAAPLLLLLVLAPLCHSQKNFIVTGQQRVQRAA